MHIGTVKSPWKVLPLKNGISQCLQNVENSSNQIHNNIYINVKPTIKLMSHMKRFATVMKWEIRLLWTIVFCYIPPYHTVPWPPWTHPLPRSGSLLVLSAWQRIQHITQILLSNVNAVDISVNIVPVREIWLVSELTLVLKENDLCQACKSKFLWAYHSCPAPCACPPSLHPLAYMKRLAAVLTQEVRPLWTMVLRDMPHHREGFLWHPRLAKLTNFTIIWIVLKVGGDVIQTFLKC